MSDFETKRKKWLEEVAEGCHNLAIVERGNPDFYVFQSKSDFESPELLIIGANPGKKVDYLDKMNEKGIERRFGNDLGYNSNQYIENENNPEWKINKPILKMFTETDARKALENSVIMNVVYFNTAKVEDLKKYRNGKEMINFCTAKTKEFIYEILKPKNILFLGVDAPKWMNIKFHHIEDSIVRTENNENYLVIKIEQDNIPHHIIHHPSMNQKFNSGKNLELKRNYFNQYFKK